MIKYRIAFCLGLRIRSNPNTLPKDSASGIGGPGGRGALLLYYRVLTGREVRNCVNYRG